jgi:hypothetical protein
MFACIVVFMSLNFNVSIVAQSEDTDSATMPIIIHEHHDEDIAPQAQEKEVIPNAAAPAVRESSAVVLRQDEPKLRYDSSDATVMAMAQGYSLLVHRQFVGTLRKSGFTGTM